MKTDEYMDED